MRLALGIVPFAVSLQFFSPTWACKEELQTLVAPPSTPFAPWDRAAPLHFQATQFLPESFLAQIADEVGPVELRQDLLESADNLFWKVTIKNHLSLDIVAKPADGDPQQILKVAMWPDPRDPGTMVIENLRIETPLATAGNLAHSQKKKGVPSTVFRHARNQIFLMAKAGGYEKVGTGGSQNYLVLMLYRKLVGMEPANERALKTIDHLDRLFEYAKRHLPEKFLVGSADDFSRMIGDVNSKVSPDTLRVWMNFHRHGIEERGMKLLWDGPEVVGFIYQGKVHFIDPVTQAPYDFRKALLDRRLELAKALTP